MDHASSRLAIFPVVLLTAAISSVVSTVVALSVATPTEPPSSAVHDCVDLSPVLDRLDTLGRQITDAHTTRQRHVAEALEPTDSKVGAIDVERIEEALRHLGAQLRGPRALQVPRDAPPNWNDLYRLAALDDTDHESAQQSVVMLTVPEIVQRFGFPSRIVPGQDGIFCLQYFRLGPDGKKESGRVTFYIRDGYVAFFESRLR